MKQSFLIEITAVIFSRKDDLTDSGHVLDKILDKTGPRPKKNAKSRVFDGV